MINWIKIEDQAPEEARRLLYFFEGTGVWTGFYYGRDEDYPEEGVRRVETDKEFYKEAKKEMLEIQKEQNQIFNNLFKQ